MLSLCSFDLSKPNPTASLGNSSRLSFVLKYGLTDPDTILFKVQKSAQNISTTAATEAQSI